MDNNIYERLQKLSQKQLAALAIELQSKLETKLEDNLSDGTNNEDIAVISIGCRFPGGANSPKKYWDLLKNGIDGVDEVPFDRWNMDCFYDPDPDKPCKTYCKLGGFLKDTKIDSFDAAFFGIAPVEAQYMDPQHRLLLEVTWEALEYAGIPPLSLSGSKTGVFIGIGSNDYSYQQSKEDLSTYSAVGNAYNLANGRLSYFLGLEGPSMAIDTACSSSLVAVHQACTSLSKNECNMALAGGVNLLLTPGGFVSLSKAKILSPDGKCKTFDESANGYARGEGCGVVVLKRLSDAIQNKDEIMAVIRGSAVNNSGRSGGLTVPKGSAQQSVIRAALKNANVKPEHVAYIEAHGTGTSLGDVIELQSLGEVFGENHSKEKPLYIGSSKTNIGHLEAASGIAGLIKVILSIYNQQIPAHLHLKDMNPHISLEEINGKIPQSFMQWPKGYEKKIAGVSSFGFSGTNAHVILEEAPHKKIETTILDTKPYYMMTLSAKSEKALEEYVSSIKQYLSENSQVSLSEVCYVLACRRSHFNHRFVMISSSLADANNKLNHYCSESKKEGIYIGEVDRSKRQKIKFIYTNHVFVYASMGKTLYHTFYVFKKSLDQCSEILKDYIDKSIFTILEDENLIKDDIYSQIVLFCIQYALTELFKSFNIIPTVVESDGIGKYVVACSAGNLDLREGLEIITSRMFNINPNLSECELENCEIIITIGPSDEDAFDKNIQRGENVIFLSSLKEDENEYMLLMNNLSRLYITGIDMNLSCLYSETSKRLHDLPTYPFQREHLWVGSMSPISNLSLDYKCLWEKLEKTSQDVCMLLNSQFNFVELKEGKKQLDLLCVQYIINFLKDLEIFGEQDKLYSINDIIDNHGILNRYDQLLAQWFDSLVNLGLLDKNDDVYSNLKEPNYPFLEENISKMKSDTNEANSSLKLIEQCGNNLKPILMGEIEPQAILFQGGNFDIIEGIYHDNEISRFYYNMAKHICETIFSEVPENRQIRILEIGAGTGSLTESILPILPPQRTKYVYTDISNSFLSKAAFHFRDYDFIEYSLLNIEESIEKQGFENGSFDIVLASNVLHATKNVKESLENTAAVLAPGGILILLELTELTLFFNMTFGLVKTKILDPVLRPDNRVFLSPDEWVNALTIQGFEKNIQLFPPNDFAEGNILGQHLIVATKVKTLSSMETALKDAFSIHYEYSAYNKDDLHQKNDFNHPERKITATEEELNPKELDETFIKTLREANLENRVTLLTGYLKKIISAILGFSTSSMLDENLSLVELGVDSLMLVDLRKILEVKLGISLPNGTFYENPTIHYLAEYFNKEMVNMASSFSNIDQLIALRMKPDEENKYVPFPLTSVQKAYITPYSNDGKRFLLTGGYYEFESKRLDITKLNDAFDKLIMKHDMMRAIILEGNRQGVVKEVPNYEVDIIDLRGKSNEEIKCTIETARLRSNYAICQTGQWPLFDVKVHILDEQKMIINIFLPGFMMDAVGEGLFFRGLMEFYMNLDTKIENTVSSFRSYVMTIQSLSTHEVFKKSKSYWWEKILELPPAIELPFVKAADNIGDYNYETQYKVIDFNTWSNCKKIASKLGLTPAGYLCAVLCEVLHHWSKAERFSINAMAYNRLIPHPEINNIMGNMSSTILIGADFSIESFDERSKAIQKQIFDGFNNRYVSSVQVLGELENTYTKLSHKKTENSIEYLLPVMFDSLLNISSDPAYYSWLGNMTYQRVERHPEVLDCQVMESKDGELIIKWDAVDYLLSREQRKEMFEKYVDFVSNALYL